MGFRQILSSSFQLLIERPLLFLPKLLDAVVWSWFWLTAAHGLTDPSSLTVPELQTMLLFLLIMLPIQIWLYNGYFIIVRQYHTDSIDMIQAFREGLIKLPEGFGAFILPFLIGTVLALPGTLLFIAGVAGGDPMLQAAGLILASLAVIGTGILFYFAPVSVILGDRGFLDEFMRGYRTSQENRHEVLLITLLSFGLLGLTTVLEGRLEQIGVAGFVAGRLVSSVINLYVLLINPVFLLEVEE